MGKGNGLWAGTLRDFIKEKDEDMQHKLIAVIGNTPQVMTETFWALRQQDVPIDEVFVMTTTMGKATCQKRLLDEGRFEKMLVDCDIDPDTVKFDADHVLVFKDAEGNHLDDIRTSEENRLARDQIFHWIEKWTRDDSDDSDDSVALHCSLAGGRKSMGYLLGAAIQFFGRPQDRLYHVLVTPPEIEMNRDFFFPPIREAQIPTSDGQHISTADVRIELADLPYVSVRDISAFGDESYDRILQKTQEEVSRVPRLRAENKRLRETSGNAGGLLGSSFAMRKIKDQIRQLADADDATVLILGETGTGKEHAFEELREHSTRKDRPYRSINCSAFPGALLDVELFGAVKGAYTGLTKDRRGAFRAADGGTLFLDEIGELSHDGQAKLLRVLQEKKVPVLGSDEQEEEVDVRIVAATNRDLKAMVQKGTFREDLLYRLDVWTIDMPPLRERRDDIPEFIDRFCEQFNERYKRNVVGFDAPAIEAMCRYTWPGNVRELENEVQRIVIAAPQSAFRVHKEDLARHIIESTDLDTANGTLEEQVAQFEKQKIEEALAQTQGNITQAAEILGVGRTKLSRKVKDYNLKGS